MSTKIEKFKNPVCNSFKTKIHNGKSCHQVDLNKLRSKVTNENELKSGFMFLMDYNEDRQVTDEIDAQVLNDENNSLMTKLFNADIKRELEPSANIFLNTIGRPESKI